MIIVIEHPFLFDRPLDLTPKEEDEARAAKGSIVMS
jgi:hypothetical protein